jgi:hypothetical protein
LLGLAAGLAALLAAVPFSNAPWLRPIAFIAGLGTAVGSIALGHWLTVSWPWPSPRKMFAALGLASAVLSLAALGVDPAARNSYSTLTGFDLRLKDWLHEHGLQRELVLTPVNVQAELQVKMKQPVLAELETVYMMQYMPSLAPRLGMMMADLYGIDFSAPGGPPVDATGRLETSSPIWSRAWSSWPTGHWQRLSRKYSFRFVLSEVPVHLPVVVEGPRLSLYEIPAPGLRH